VRAFFGGAAAERLMRCGNDETAAVGTAWSWRGFLAPLPEPQGDGHTAFGREAFHSTRWTLRAGMAELG